MRLIKLPHIMCFGLCLAINGCASMQFGDLFSTYSQQLTPTRQLINANQPQQALTTLSQHTKGSNNYLVSLLEHAKTAHFAKNYAHSETVFAEVIDILKQEELKAAIQISNTTQHISALVTNDTALEYTLPYYEQVMVHHYQALNYLYMNNIESAVIEARKAYQVQQRALKDQELDLVNQQLTQSVTLDSLSNTYAELDRIIGNDLKGIDNPYTAVLSAILLESADEANNAYISYQSALALNPTNAYLQQQVERLSSQLGIEEHSTLGNKGIHDSDNQLIVLIEQSLIPKKQEQNINLPIYTSQGEMRFYSVALPSYSQAQPSVPISISLNGSNLNSQPLVDFQALAAANLKQIMPTLIARQTARLIAKEQVRKKLAKEGGDVGNVLATLYNIASERADTRSWLTLPANAQIITSPLSDNTDELLVHYRGHSHAVAINPKHQGVTLVTIYTADQLFNVETSYL
ncbi:COG3014 family protein [Pseudoalteromonas ulvae]|uniref:COG3014 family protein n=1 Tax=Pseudoalteromonas ulvae TaxID=107327 RepID=UPI00186B7AC4|nr:hypothetical protein [Pseudoalteromonas ulvae]